MIDVSLFAYAGRTIENILIDDSIQELEERRKACGIPLNDNSAGSQNGCDVLSPCQQVTLVLRIKIASHSGGDRPDAVPYIEDMCKISEFGYDLEGCERHVCIWRVCACFDENVFPTCL